MPSDKPCLADVPQEVYDELQIYRTCYEYLRQWQKEWDSSESGGQHVYFRRMQLAKDTRELLAEVEKMQEQQRKAQT